MIELLPISIGIGLAIGLLFTELFGIAAGGMIVPGYLALSLNRPLDVAATVLAGFLTYGIIAGLSSFALIYGRRRTVLMILTGYVVGMLFRILQGGMATEASELQVIGYIIPGLIAIWLDRQGIIETVAALVTASVVVRLILIVILGAEVRA